MAFWCDLPSTGFAKGGVQECFKALASRQSERDSISSVPLSPVRSWRKSGEQRCSLLLGQSARTGLRCAGRSESFSFVDGKLRREERLAFVCLAFPKPGKYGPRANRLGPYQITSFPGRTPSLCTPFFAKIVFTQAAGAASISPDISKVPAS